MHGNKRALLGSWTDGGGQREKASPLSLLQATTDLPRAGASARPLGGTELREGLPQNGIKRQLKVTHDPGFYFAILHVLGDNW